MVNRILNQKRISWGMKMRGQLSAEMLILIVVILAIVGIAAVQLVGTAKETSGNIDDQTEKLGEMTSEAIKSPEGGYCFTEDDCKSGLTCPNYRCV